MTKHDDLPMLDEADFDAKVARSPLPVLLDFGAAWCAPCRALEPTVAAVAEKLRGRATVYRVDADESAALAAKYRVRALPTVIAFVGGEERARHTGNTSASVLLGLLGA